jgi:hypothetical protein
MMAATAQSPPARTTSQGEQKGRGGYLGREEKEMANQKRIGKAMSDIGQYSSGIIAIEAWVLNDKKTCLIRPDGAWWRDPFFQPPSHMDKETCLEYLQKLEDPSVEGYEAPQPLQPGLGLAGKLWAEKNMKSVRGGESILSAFGSFHGGGRGQMSPQSPHGIRGSSPAPHHKMKHKGHGFLSSSFLTSPLKETLIWRGLNFLDINPHHISDNRLKTFLKAGIGQVAGMSFELPSSQGIVLFFAKSDVDKNVLDDKRNVDFLKASAPFIGSSLALSIPMIESWQANQEVQETRSILLLSKKEGQTRSNSTSSSDAVRIDDDVEKNKSPNQCTDTNSSPSIILETSTAGTTDDVESNDNSSKPEDSSTNLSHTSKKRFASYDVRMKNYTDIIKAKLLLLKDKVLDSNTTAHPPPNMSNGESIWTFVGSFVTLICVCFLSEAISFWNGKSNKYAVPIGPIGAFTTLLYGLTSAPPGQPRNAIYGSAIAGCTALVMSNLPSNLLSLRISLATSISITMMARCGVTHPPGGALAVMLSMGDYNWSSLLFYLMSLVAVIAIAIVINNLNEKRKYPQYWNMVPKVSFCCK